MGRVTVDAEDLRSMLTDEPSLVAFARLSQVLAIHDELPEHGVDENRMVGMPTPTAKRMRSGAMGRSGTLRREVFDRVMARPDGMSDDEIEMATGRAHQSISATRNLLVKDGWLVPLMDGEVPVTRRNRYGNQAQLWVGRGGVS